MSGAFELSNQAEHSPYTQAFLQHPGNWYRRLLCWLTRPFSLLLAFLEFTYELLSSTYRFYLDGSYKTLSTADQLQPHRSYEYYDEFLRRRSRPAFWRSYSTMPGVSWYKTPYGKVRIPLGVVHTIQTELIDSQWMYRYQKLKSRRSIRLLRFMPTPLAGSNEVTCTMDEYALDRGVVYSALSYSWSASDEDEYWRQEPSTLGHDHIICNRKRLHVQPRVVQALRRLQREPERLIWIDAICINQEDTDERNQQVSMMGDVYKQANTVIVWLGEARVTSWGVLRFIHEVAWTSIILAFFPRVRDAWIIRQADRYMAYDISLSFQSRNVRHLFGTVPYSLLSDVLDEIYLRTWFSRMWCVQEASMARNIRILVGPWSIPWSVLTFAANQAADMTTRGPALGYSVALGARRLQLHRSSRASIANRSARPRMTRILAASRRMDVTEPKDKIFSLYGLFKEFRMFAPTVDYRKSLAIVNQEIAYSAITHDNSLEALLYTEGHTNPNISLVSWAPHWDLERAQDMQYHAFCATLDSNASFYFTTSKQGLIVRGSVVDTIARRSVRRLWVWHERLTSERLLTAEEARGKFLRPLAGWMTMANSLYENPHVQKSFTPEEFRKAFCLTLVQGGAKGAERYPEYFWKAFQNWWPAIWGAPTEWDKLIEHHVVHSTIEGKNESRFVFKGEMRDPSWRFLRVINATKEGSMFQHHLMSKAFWKLFVTTQEGRMGMCNMEVEEKDLVALVAGLPVPMLFREVGMVLNSDIKRYRCIGPAYIHGIMDGEAWSRDQKTWKEFMLV